MGAFTIKRHKEKEKMLTPQTDDVMADLLFTKRRGEKLTEYIRKRDEIQLELTRVAEVINQIVESRMEAAEIDLDQPTGQVRLETKEDGVHLLVNFPPGPRRLVGTPEGESVPKTEQAAISPEPEDAPPESIAS